VINTIKCSVFCTIFIVAVDFSVNTFFHFSVFYKQQSIQYIHKPIKATIHGKEEAGKKEEEKGGRQES
jgi:hypothetical protein